MDQQKQNGQNPNPTQAARMIQPLPPLQDHTGSRALTDEESAQYLFNVQKGVEIFGQQ